MADKSDDTKEVFGHEPVLEALAKDKNEVKLAKAGSTETDAGGLTSVDMTPVNSTPPGDDAGEPRHADQPGDPEPERSPGTRPAKK